MKISNNTGFISHQLCFLKPLFRLSTQGLRISKLERIQLVIVWLYNSLNDVSQVIQSGTEDIIHYKLLAHLIETHIISPSVFVVAKLPDLSEMDISLQFWGRGKKLDSSTFKIDYMVGFVNGDTFITLSCIEVGRFASNDKIRDDHHKLLLEGKVIINNIIKTFSFINPQHVPILNMQVCGMKGDLIETIMGNKKKYIAHRPIGRLRAPLNYNNAKATEIFLRQLIYYKDHLQDLKDDIQQMINERNDKRASFKLYNAPDISHIHVLFPSSLFFLFTSNLY